MNGRYFLFTPFSEEQPNQFTPEETDLLRQLIQSGATDNVLQDVYCENYNSILTFHLQTRSQCPRRPCGEVDEAINDRFQAQLIGYYLQAAHTSDRVVELYTSPITFGCYVYER